jgi:hypothetical protein
MGGGRSVSGRGIRLTAFGGRLFNLLDDVFIGFLPNRLHQVFLGVLVGGGVEGDFLGFSGVSSSDDDVGDSFQLGERLTDVLFTAVSRDACHGDRVHGLRGGLSRADPCEQGQRGECHGECFHGFDFDYGLATAVNSVFIMASFSPAAIRELAYGHGWENLGGPADFVAGWVVMTRGPARWIPALVALVALLAMAGGGWVLRSFDPARGSLLPACRFNAVTGLQCPGCGMTRATHHLLNGRVREAFYYNAFYVATLPGLVVWAGWWVHRWWSQTPLSPRARKTNAWLGGSYLACWLVFWLARNFQTWPML